MARLSFRCDEELVAAVDEARGHEPREHWLRRAIHLMLEFGDHGEAVEQALDDGGSRGGASDVVARAAPAQQPREYKGHVVRSSSARPFRPAPKKEER